MLQSLDRRLRGLAIACALCTIASAGSRLDALGSDDAGVVATTVAAIEHAPADADELFAAARACEGKLVDPPRALVLYERIVREAPGARVAIAAGRRAAVLREELGPHAEHAKQAIELARLIADADRIAPSEIEARAHALASSSWPGARDALLWLAEWQRRRSTYDRAEASYLEVARRWPDSRQAALGRRGAAGAALDAHQWNRAAELAAALPSANDSDALERSELLSAAERGARRAALYTIAWIALVLALVALVGSFGEAIVRGGLRWPAWRPPIEVLFLAPVAAVLVAISFTAHRAIAPAVVRISIAGVVLAWLSGSALDLVRARGRSVRARAIGHVIACAIGVVAIGYIAMTRDGLIDLLVETAQSGPET